ncbi:MAG: hypothetical protein ACI4QW_03265 [Clostridia bacterium]
MKKSVYSLVLTDSVVEAADRLAYRKGMSRSALIDELLAQALSCMTPEMRMRDIFVSLEDWMRDDGIFKLQNRASDSMMSLLSAIRYKYKPTIRYSVELYRQFHDGAFGELKIQSRTQNAQLMEELETFYRLWIEAEQETEGSRPAEYYLSEGRLSRRLTLPPEVERCSETALGEAIGGYIQSFDKAMKLYFDHLPDRRLALEKIRAVYADYVKENTMLI